MPAFFYSSTEPWMLPPSSDNHDLCNDGLLTIMETTNPKNLVANNIPLFEKGQLVPPVQVQSILMGKTQRRSSTIIPTHSFKDVCNHQPSRSRFSRAPLIVAQDSDAPHPSLQQQVSRLRPPLVESHEKVGGVALHLDYEMEVMVDFVADMAYGMHTFLISRICLADIDIARSVIHSKDVPPQGLRKFILQVLSSTRLPSSTILFGLLYLSKRMATLSEEYRYERVDTSIRSMLVVALMLGSKFLDDNTFQNRSWSEVSGISVKTLNFLEFHWLADIKWDMHIDQDDPDGFYLWRQHWMDFARRREERSLSKTLAQFDFGDTSLEGRDTSKQRLCPLTIDGLDRGLASSELYSVDGYMTWARKGSQGIAWHPTRPELTPPSAPDTGPTTPDNYNFLESDIYRYAAAPYHDLQAAPLRVFPARIPMQCCTLQAQTDHQNQLVPCIDGCRWQPYHGLTYMACA